MPREALLARTLVELADTLVDDFDVVDLLTLLADRCVEMLDVRAAGLMLAAPEGALRVVASSSEEMRLVELFELQAEEGLLPDRSTDRQRGSGRGRRPVAPLRACGPQGGIPVGVCPSHALAGRDRRRVESLPG
jgi:hypothetical protein